MVFYSITIWKMDKDDMKTKRSKVMEHKEGQQLTGVR
jgi:hypothetical protein